MATANRAMTMKIIRAEEAPAQPGHSRQASEPHGTKRNTRWTKKPPKRPEYRREPGLVVPQGGPEALQSGQAEDRLQKACGMER